MIFSSGRSMRITWTIRCLPCKSGIRPSPRWLQNFSTSRKYSSDEEYSKKPSLKSGRYSTAEQALLDEMRRANIPIKEMAKTLNRSSTSITYKLSWPRNSRDDQIIQSAQRKGLSWQQLGELLPLYSMLQIRRRCNELQAIQAGEAPISRSSRKLFTPEEKEKIVNLRGKGMEWMEMTTVMPGRTSGVLSARYLSFVPDAERKSVRRKEWWTEAEGEKLEAMLAAKCTRKQIAEALGRSLMAIKDRIRRIPHHDRMYAKGSWTKAETERLQKLVAEGTPRAEIAKTLGKTLDSIKGRIARMKRLERSVGVRT